MIVLIAHASDPWAPELARQVEAGAGELTRILTARDLSRAGWAITLSEGDDDTSDQLVIDDCRVPASQVHLIVSLITRVAADELMWIRETDTAYVADEMTAFLRFWLEHMADRVLVRPGARSLAGPDIALGSWAAAGGLHRAGTDPIDRRRTRGVSFADGFVSGGTRPSQRCAVTAMARWAGVPWLRAHFLADTDELCGVVPLPDLAVGRDAVARVITRAAEGRWAA